MMPTCDDADVGVEGEAIGMLYPLFVSLSPFFLLFFIWALGNGRCGFGLAEEMDSDLGKGGGV